MILVNTNETAYVKLCILDKTLEITNKPSFLDSLI